MRGRRRGGRLAAALALTAVAALAVPGAAFADDPPTGGDEQDTEYLKPTLSTPILGEGNQLVYEATVANDGPVTASGVRVVRSAFSCAPDKPVGDPHDCTPIMAEEVTLPDIKSGESATFPVNVKPRDSDPKQVRTAVEVTHVNEWDIGHAYPGCTWLDRTWTGCTVQITPLTG